jgi:hypothetical protein
MALFFPLLPPTWPVHTGTSHVALDRHRPQPGKQAQALNIQQSSRKIDQDSAEFNQITVSQSDRISKNQ